MQTVMIVSETQSYLLVSLQSKLEETGCRVLALPADPQRIEEVREHIDLLFVMADEALLGREEGLIALRHKAVEENIPLFVTGDDEALTAMREGVFLHLIQREFPRPVNMGEVAEYFHTYLNDRGSRKEEKKKVLVVDDAGIMLRNVKMWLEDSYQVFMANSGMMAIKYLTSNRPDLILLDYEMPVVDGSQVLEMIRSDSEFSDVPVIFLTGKGDKESVQKVMALKPAGYLLKTLPPEEIRKAVDEFFEKEKRKTMS